MTSIKAGPWGAVYFQATARENEMTVGTMAVLAVVIGMFAVFMVALGGVWIWTNLGDRKPAAARAPAISRDTAMAGR